MARAQTRDTLRGGSYVGVMACLMQLRKVCNHPDLFETRPIRTSWAMDGAPVAGFRGTEDVVRRMLSPNPCVASCARSAALSTPVVFHASSAAWAAARRLDATPALVRHAAQGARAVLDAMLAATREDAALLLLQPVQTRYTRAHSALRQRQQLEHRHAAWTRLAGLNARRVTHAPRPAACACADAVAACRIVGPLGAVSGLVSGAAERVARCLPLIERFVFVTPPVIVRNTPAGCEAVHAHLRAPLLAHSGSRWAQRDAWPDILHVRRRVHRHTGLLRPVQVRQQIAFPERFLLQYDCGKLQALDRLLAQLVRDGHRVLIFTQMTRVLDILEQWLNLHAYRYLRLDGATSVEQRWRLTERFNHERRWSVFISSTRAGGLGINLTGADTVVFYDSDWNHAMDAQCQDRCHRIGQQREVRIYRLISDRTVEEAIWRKQCEKRWLNQVVIQDGNFSGQSTAQPPGAMAGAGPAPLGVSDWYDLAGSMLAESNGAVSTAPGAVRAAAAASERDALGMLAAAEDEVDAAALKVAIAEVAQADALDLGEADELPPAANNAPNAPGGNGGLADTAADGNTGSTGSTGNNDNDNDNNDDEEDGVGHVDDYMMRFVSDILFAQNASTMLS
ncbi:swr1 complex component [Kickxella alabastrina]|uniref:Swr1 complex component n=1 Tax=Kickxella alabastrina TaxID=61397 RepID=A0ACC1IE91_9FUNG|nr:swr1 complex component [Kickxella alabastrina]